MVENNRVVAGCVILNLKDARAVRAHPEMVRCDRTTRWGNSFRIGRDGNREDVIRKHREQLWDHIGSGQIKLEDLAPLAGKPLACWCAPQACHAENLAKASAYARDRLAERAQAQRGRRGMTTENRDETDNAIEALNDIGENVLMRLIDEAAGHTRFLRYQGDMEEIIELAQAVIANRTHDEAVPRRGMTYMRRWVLKERRVGQPRCYLHEIMRDDLDTPHDHPWASAGLLIKGALNEQWWRNGKDLLAQASANEARLEPGMIAVRPQEHIHRLQVDETKGTTVTLFATTPKNAEWGFWKTRRMGALVAVQGMMQNAQCRQPVHCSRSIDSR